MQDTRVSAGFMYALVVCIATSGRHDVPASASIRCFGSITSSGRFVAYIVRAAVESGFRAMFLKTNKERNLAKQHLTIPIDDQT